MRLGGRSHDAFIGELNAADAAMQEAFHARVRELTGTVRASVMLGDSTVTEQETFDPRGVTDYFHAITRRLAGWSVQGVSVANNDDVRRVFAKFESDADGYAVSGHVSAQFHVLLYYRPDQRVLDCQRELAGLVDQAAGRERRAADEGDGLVLQRLREAGHRDLGHQGLFEALYNDDGLREGIAAEVEAAGDPGAAARKAELLAELDSLLLETYSMAPVPIDEQRLVTGEEGCMLAVDVGPAGGGALEPAEIPAGAREAIRTRLAEMAAAVSKDQGTGA